MTIRWILAVGMALLVGTVTAQDVAVLEGDKARLSYALGMNFWLRLRDQSIEVDPALCIQGFRDALSGSDTLLTETEVRTILTDLQAELRQRQSTAQTEQPLQKKRELETRSSANKTREAVVAPVQLKDIQVFFKVDPRLTRSLYMGDRWVSPPTYTGTRQTGTVYTMEARTQGIDARGGSIPVSPEWIPSDPGMVAVAPATGDAVTITVKRAGESILRVAANGIARELIIRATKEGEALQVEISR